MGVIVVWSDTHAPYQHQDATDFLYAINKIYQPDLSICLDDIADFSKINMHERNPQGPYTAKEEILQSRKFIKEVGDIFPETVLTLSNHSTLPWRQADKAGLPRIIIRDLEEILEVPPGWRLVPRFKVEDSGFKILFAHSLKCKNSLMASQKRGMCVMQGHYHSDYGVQYWRNENNEYLWGATCCSLIDREAMAFAYAQDMPDYPLGCFIIIAGRPFPVPMILDKNKRWVKKIL